VKAKYTPTGFDVIGDIHGEFEMLVRLLRKLGYRPMSRIAASNLETATWGHPNRTAVFVGDLIDRGPDTPRVLSLVRRMIVAGTARAIMGNHEFNAIGHAKPDGRGGWLRPRTPDKIGPHQTTLDQFAGDPQTWADHLSWFRTLPTALDLGGFRVVHAAWHGPSIARISGAGHWTDETLAESYFNATSKTARELILNGPEVELPPGAYFHDHGGKRRTAIRTAWWETGNRSNWTQIVFPPSRVLRGLDNAVAVEPPAAFYGLNEPPVVFGHYALGAGACAIQARNAACVDFGCGKGGALGAYRWDGEHVLSEFKVVRVFPARP
jgi:hypothetical protein